MELVAARDRSSVGALDVLWTSVQRRPERSGEARVAARTIIYGIVAQLGERCVRNAEVEGSNPFGSIQKDSPVLPGCLSVINLRIQVCDKASPLWSALNARPMDEHLSFILYLKASKTT